MIDIYESLKRDNPEYYEKHKEVLLYAERSLIKRGITQVTYGTTVSDERYDVGIRLALIPSNMINMISSTNYHDLFGNTEYSAEMLEFYTFKNIYMDLGQGKYQTNPAFVHIPRLNILMCRLNMFYDKEVYIKIRGFMKTFDLTVYHPPSEKELMVQTLSKIRNQITSEYIESVKTKQADIDNYVYRINQAMTSICLFNATIDRYNQLTDDILVSKIEQCRQIPVVEKIEFTEDNLLRIYLKPTYINTPLPDSDGNVEPRKVYIGRLRFEVNLVDKNISVYNLDKGVSDKVSEVYPHPHASRDNYPCFGENSNLASKYIVELDFVELVKLFYSWSISYDEQSVYSNILNWWRKQW